MLENCDFPNLPAEYDVALRDAVSFVLASFTPVGIIASGTILRGNPDATSDIDLWVIHLEPMRQRVQKFFNAVPVEIFVNPPWTIQTYLRRSNPMPGRLRPISWLLAMSFWPLIRLWTNCAEKLSGYSRNRLT